MKKITTKMAMAVIMLFAINAKAQKDTLFKLNGDKIICKVFEVGTNAVSYKKATKLDGPIYTELKSNLAYMVLENGEKVDFFDTDIAGSTSASAGTSTVNPSGSNNSNGTQSAGKITIVTEKKKKKTVTTYFLQSGNSTDQLKMRKLNSILSQSSNPAVVASAKAAKTVRIVGIAIKIFSFPSTAAGAVGDFATVKNWIYQAQHGGVTTKTVIGAISSGIGTAVFPISAAILKKKQKKLYKKAIDLYDADAEK